MVHKVKSNFNEWWYGSHFPDELFRRIYIFGTPGILLSYLEKTLSFLAPSTALVLNFYLSQSLDIRSILNPTSFSSNSWWGRKTRNSSEPEPNELATIKVVDINDLYFAWKLSSNGQLHRRLAATLTQIGKSRLSPTWRVRMFNRQRRAGSAGPFAQDSRDKQKVECCANTGRPATTHTDMSDFQKFEKKIRTFTLYSL